MMKKHSDEPAAKSHVRYMGFESSDIGRRLRFRVKPFGRESVEVTIDVPDDAFIRTRGISIQDAVPMAYEKIVQLIATGGDLNSDTSRLTDADIAHYLDRHESSQKRAYSRASERAQSDIEA
jgi:hypothetical protein